MYAKGRAAQCCPYGFPVLIRSLPPSLLLDAETRRNDAAHFATVRLTSVDCSTRAPAAGNCETIDPGATGAAGGVLPAPTGGIATSTKIGVFVLMPNFKSRSCAATTGNPTRSGIT